MGERGERERIGEGRDGPGSVNREQAKGVRSENEPRAPSMRRAHTEIIALDGLAHARPRHESRRPFYAPSSHWRTSPIACAPSPARTCGQITFSLFALVNLCIYPFFVYNKQIEVQSIFKFRRHFCDRATCVENLTQGPGKALIIAASRLF